MTVKIATKSIEGDSLSIDFSDGESVNASLDGLSPEIVANLAMHGLSQKVGDSYAGEKDVEVARLKAQSVVDRLVAGEWKAARESGGGGKISDLANALANVTGQELATCVEKLSEMDKAQKSALRKHPKIAAEVARIAFERAEAKAESAGDLALEI